MKKYLIILPALLACALSNAMEQRYQNTDETGRQNQNIQNDSTRHYTLADLRQGSTASAVETLSNVQTEASNDSFDDYLAFFGLQEGYTVNQLLDRYNLYECTTAEVMNRRYEAFSALYPYAQRDQQEGQQQVETTFFNQNNYDYGNYYLPESFASASHARSSETMEVDEPNHSEPAENAYAENNSIDGTVVPQDDQSIEQLCDEIEQAIQFGAQNDRMLYSITKYLFRHENYIHVPRNIWFGLPSYSTFQTEWQTSMTVQPDFIGAHESIKGIYTSVIDVQVMYKYDIHEGFKLRFSYTRRKFIVTTLNNYYLINDDDTGNQDNNNDNNGSASTNGN